MLGKFVKLVFHFLSPFLVFFLEYFWRLVIIPLCYLLTKRLRCVGDPTAFIRFHATPCLNYHATTDRPDSVTRSLLAARQPSQTPFPHHPERPDKRTSNKAGQVSQSKQFVFVRTNQGIVILTTTAITDSKLSCIFQRL